MQFGPHTISKDWIYGYFYVVLVLIMFDLDKLYTASTQTVQKKLTNKKKKNTFSPDVNQADKSE